MIKKMHFEVAYVVGIYDHQTNRCYYLNKSNYTMVFRSLSGASVMGADTANRIVERNKFRGKKLVYNQDRKKIQLFVSKVFYNSDNDIIKLTKHNSFQLMELITNNI